MATIAKVAPLPSPNTNPPAKHGKVDLKGSLVTYNHYILDQFPRSSSKLLLKLVFFSFFFQINFFL